MCRTIFVQNGLEDALRETWENLHQAYPSISTVAERSQRTLCTVGDISIELSNIIPKSTSVSSKNGCRRNGPGCAPGCTILQFLDRYEAALRNGNTTCSSPAEAP
ncbi:hypothetical protein Trydic_g19068 [Trypoxylus dichotomus]